MATELTGSGSARVRSRLGHPVIDADGHWLEPVPIFLDYLRLVAGQTMVDQFLRNRQETRRWYELTPEQRLHARVKRPEYWAFPGTAIDRATAMIPRLMYERLSAFGIDYALIYPTLGLLVSRFPEDELRRSCVRALNTMAAEMFRPYSDRMTPVGIVPTFTPLEAVEEAAYIVSELGMKAALISGIVRRSLESDAEWQPDPAKRRHYIDCLAMDSPYDYDPLWAKMVELRLAATIHSGNMSGEERTSPTSFVFNHLGHFAQANHVSARGLFLGGVTQRFPNLTFAFLEGGVAWACALYSDLIAHWRKRNRNSMLEHLRPNNVDEGELRELFEQYASDPRFHGNTNPVGLRRELVLPRP